MNSHEHNSNHDDSFATLVREAVAGEALPASDPTLREALLKRLDQPAVEPALKVSMADRRRTFFQRAGIALASTAALALVGVIWQRPALERAIGMRHADAVQTKALHEAELQQGVLLSNRSRPGQGLGAGRGAGDRPESDADASVYSSRAEGREKAGESVRAGDSGPSRARYSNDESGRSDRWGDGVTNGELREASPRRIPQTVTRAVPPHDPYGTVAPGPTTAPAPIVTGTAPASQPTVPAGLTPSTESSGSSIAGRPASGKPMTFNEQAERTVNQFYAVPEPKPAAPAATPAPDLNGPVANAPASRLPAQPGDPQQKYLEQTDKRLGLKSEVDRLQTYKESLKNQEGQPSDAPVVASSSTSPAKGPEVGSGPQKPDAGDQAEAKTRWMMAKLKEGDLPAIEAVLREKIATEELAKRTKALEDQIAAQDQFARQYGAEQYAKIVENQFLRPLTEATALSTFAIDVDTASYANVRRFLTGGQLPPPDAVRLEELVNYFKYKYPQPKGDDPFSVSTEMADCPWQPGHKLLRVGVQGKEIHRQERPASNIVFLIDTSGSMTDQNKLPLLKQAFTMLVGELNENDKVTMVTYAGNAGLKLPPTRGHEKETIIAAIDNLQSGGSTHGSAGISLAYEVAAAQFIKGGTNKVILATDGDLNVGITDDAQLVDLITKKAKTGVYLTVLGVGTGNLKDAKMERLANNGNGIYAYLDTVKEAQKVLVEQMSGSLVTIAKDVKIQVEFNENQVHSYRLLGYENRVMANEDFRNDAKDAGEIGAGHSVTAMYEVVLVDPTKKEAEPKAEPQPAEKRLRYKRYEPGKTVTTEEGKSEELLTVRLRYKQPDAKEEDAAKELEFPLKDKGSSFNSASKDFQFASSVVAFGLALRQSEFRGSANYSAVAEIAAATVGEDVGGHRAEFVDLVKRAKTLRGE